MNVARIDPMSQRNPLARRPCTAHTRGGAPCRQWAMRGQRVCKLHGGKAPQALRTAQERIAALVDPALVELARLVRVAETDAVKLAAIKDVLDRAGLKPKERVEQSGRIQIEVVYGDSADAGENYVASPALGPASDQS